MSSRAEVVRRQLELQQPTAPAASDEVVTWECSVCTLVNEADAPECAACGSVPAGEEPLRDEPAAPTPGRSSENGDPTLPSPRSPRLPTDLPPAATPRPPRPESVRRASALALAAESDSVVFVSNPAGRTAAEEGDEESESKEEWATPTDGCACCPEPGGWRLCCYASFCAPCAVAEIAHAIKRSRVLWGGAAALTQYSGFVGAEAVNLATRAGAFTELITEITASVSSIGAAVCIILYCTLIGQLRAAHAKARGFDEGEGACWQPLCCSLCMLTQQVNHERLLASASRNGEPKDFAAVRGRRHERVSAVGSSVNRFSSMI
jgi:hypothetical protein